MKGEKKLIYTSIYISRPTDMEIKKLFLRKIFFFVAEQNLAEWVEWEALGDGFEREIGDAGRGTDLQNMQRESSIHAGQAVTVENAHEHVQRGLGWITVGLQACAGVNQRVDEKVAHTGREASDRDLLHRVRLGFVAIGRVALLRSLVNGQVDARARYDSDRVGNEATVERAYAMHLVDLVYAVNNRLELARLAQVHDGLHRLERIKHESRDESGRTAAHNLLAESLLLVLVEQVLQLLVCGQANGVLGRRFYHIHEVASPHALPLAFVDHEAAHFCYAHFAAHFGVHALYLKYRFETVDWRSTLKYTWLKSEHIYEFSNIK